MVEEGEQSVVRKIERLTSPGLPKELTTRELCRLRIATACPHGLVNKDLIPLSEVAGKAEMIRLD
jgi:hypothetical protein